MTVTSAEDPLSILPPEIVLRVLDFASISTLAALSSASRAWHEFIDVTHQDAIYSSEARTSLPPNTPRDLSFLSKAHNFSKSFEGTASWKEFCKRQTALAQNWADSTPITRESVLQVGNDPVWRFRPDFKRRFFVSTSHVGGLNVTDMDTGRILWRMPSSEDRDDYAVRPYAHLEYQDGMAVFDREGDAVEVWQADVDDAPRGEFRRIAVLHHDCQTRGFQLSYDTLCVVSNQGQGFVYDMTQRPPQLKTHLSIENGAIGHLDQSHDAVIYSVGAKGYHVYNKATGSYLGALHPSRCTNRYHIRPPAPSSRSASAALAGAARHGPTHRVFPPGPPRKDFLTPLELLDGPLSPAPSDPEHVWHGEDEWGAGMLDGDLFVGFSRAGRVFVCSNWRKAIHEETAFTANTSIIECETDGSSFDLGGWLAVRNHRVMFEIQDRIYIVALDDRNKIQTSKPPFRASYALATSSAPQLAVPVSFMTLCDDAIMTTYTTLGWRQTLSNIPGDVSQQRHENHTRIFPTKAIRIVSLNPNSVAISNSHSNNTTPDHSAATNDDASDPNRALAEDAWRSQASLLEVISMLQDEFEEEEEEDGGAELLMAELQNDGVIDGDWEDISEGDDDGEDERPFVSGT
ncbi:hypothetical protein N7478_009284 [Penicillium angulare]|uniref:uncharacterized protein n=1 Tax=Penicillium angulare TaxID=116970 RepID=UPI002540D335|nr:uncharacterized protein N7478_009284 [Penicillium angulare]KAJ5266476.1 hypothetical protein N7478_009284 [Penicillium angulare]